MRGSSNSSRILRPILLGFGIAVLTAWRVGAQASLAPHLADRGTGIRTSIFGTYVRPGELLVSPFFEYYLDNDYEYKPSELGYVGPFDHRGRYRASEGLLFLAYGLTDWLALELEGAVISATLEKSPTDNSPMPSKLTASGQGDIQAQLDFRMLRETAGRPELFSFIEVVFPSNKSEPLIGTPDWEFKAGGGLTRGYSWGTMTARIAAEYSRAERKADVGEWAIEYLKRLSPRWRVYLGVEGVQDEVEAITEAQWHPNRHFFVRLNNAFGVTSKATDWAPDVGVVFSLATR